MKAMEEKEITKVSEVLKIYDIVYQVTTRDAPDIRTRPHTQNARDSRRGYKQDCTHTSDTQDFPFFANVVYILYTGNHYNCPRLGRVLTMLPTCCIMLHIAYSIHAISYYAR